MKIVSTVTLLLLAGMATAAPSVFTDVYEFGPLEGIIWDTPGGILADATVDWDHFNPYGGDPANIVAASLTIEAEGVENVFSLALEDLDLDLPFEDLDMVTVFFNGYELGNMDGDTTTFDLDLGYLAGDPYETEAVITFQFDGISIIPPWVDLTDAVRLNRSTLSVTAVPAPEAILLCAIGTSLAGYLKRRRSI